VAFPACAISGTVGLPSASADRRPTITHGLALSVYYIFNGRPLFSNYYAILFQIGNRLKLNKILFLPFFNTSPAAKNCPANYEFFPLIFI
jgi:hypothetical protein